VRHSFLDTLGHCRVRDVSSGYPAMLHLLEFDNLGASNLLDLLGVHPSILNLRRIVIRGHDELRTFDVFDDFREIFS